jgi:hypothetical protein
VEEEAAGRDADRPAHGAPRRPLLSALFAAWEKWHSGERPDRRRCKRYRFSTAYCRVLEPEPCRSDALLLNLSAFGACLSVPANVAVGTVLRLRLSNRKQLLAHEATLRVTHSRGTAAAPCLAGGAFGESLPPHVLHALMA